MNPLPLGVARHAPPSGANGSNEYLKKKGKQHTTPNKRGEMYAAEWNRFITGAWRGSSTERLADIAGIAELGEAMKRMKIRWAASVYERGVEVLRERGKS